ncbi:MAG: hypothetical protein RIQ81_1649 [Pseudomonadota bacterium]|jgi:hypothetical protein
MKTLIIKQTKPALQRSKRFFVAALAVVVVSTTSLHGCSGKQGGANLSAFSDGKSFLQSIRNNQNPEKTTFYRAFAKAGAPLPPALMAALAGKPIVDDGIKQARMAAAKQIAGENSALRTAGVPSDIPLVDPAKIEGLNLGQGAKLALKDDLVSANASMDGAKADAGNGAPEGGGAQQPQCIEVNATCHAKAVAMASAFACAFASAWACVYSEVQPFRSLCTWSYAGACAAAMAVAVSEVYSSTSVQVCNMCPAAGGNAPAPAPTQDIVP